MSITEALKFNRPNLSASSLKTYSSVLRNLQKNMGGEGIEWFSNNDKDILDYLKEKTPQTKKTTLSALFVLTKQQSLKDVMMTVMKSVNDTNKEQKKNEKQEEWETKSIERKYIETLFATLNGTMQGRIKNEWNEVHKDDIKNYKSLWYKQNIDKIKEKAIEYNLKNSDTIKEYKSLYYRTNIDAIKEIASVYRELHKDETLKANKKYYAENKEAILASQAEYYQLNREKIIETVKTYAGNNKEKIADYQKEHYQRNKETSGKGKNI